MNTPTYDSPFGVMGKTELALLYLPHLTPSQARRKLNAWIKRNSALTAALAETGYTHRIPLLTPVQVSFIVQYLGEP